MRESALCFVIDHAGLADVPYCREQHRTRGLVPHLTVLYPWFPAPVGPAVVERAALAVAGTGPLTVRIDRLDSFPAGVVFGALADPGPVVELMQRVWSVFPETPPYGGEFDEPVPHITLGRCEPSRVASMIDEVRAHVDGLLPIEVTLTDLGVLEQDSGGRWAVVDRMGLR